MAFSPAYEELPRIHGGINQLDGFVGGVDNTPAGDD
jgi:hypothetical protein